jgi:hypothetical protein
MAEAGRQADVDNRPSRWASEAHEKLAIAAAYLVADSHDLGCLSWFDFALFRNLPNRIRLILVFWIFASFQLLAANL